jgi:HD-GYP domain-containing protein (c-di-GMP phosphodiesterase class II)
VSSLNKLTLILVATQAVCLLTGLWIHDRLDAETKRWLAESQLPAAAGSSQPSTTRTGTEFDAPHSWALFSISYVWICGLQSAVAFLLLYRFRGEETKQQKRIEEEALQQVAHLVKTRDAVMFGLAKLAESRDPETGQHLERISLYSTRLATAMRRHPKFRGRVSPAFVRSIGISSALHDIGKVGVEDSILLKPGQLTPGERYRMQIHPTIGSECIREIELRLGKSNFLEMAREIALCHHERWDGQGYPAGLAGEEIPLAARVVAIADVYDALSSRRVYKEAVPHERCVEIIQEEAGTQFDPALVEIFLEVQHDLREIAQRLASNHEAPSPHGLEPSLAGEKYDHDLTAVPC